MTREEQIERMRILKEKLNRAAKELSEELDGAPVVCVVGGDSTHNSPATLCGWANIVEGREGRFRDVQGILSGALHIESFFHYMEDPLFRELKELDRPQTWFSRSGFQQPDTDS